MDPQVTPPTTKTAVDEQAINTAIRFLTALFVPGDLMVIRPVETWTEAGKKRSQVDYKGVRDSRCALKNLQSHWQWLTSLLTGFVKTQIDRAKETRCNVFFGVCPRFRGNGEFELAWQIRTARALWCDIDHVSTQEALQRCTDRGVPQPSVTVNSGNGAHLYWLLTEAITIDDVGDPPPVLTEWTELAGGRRKPSKYILDGKDRIYLNQRGQVEKLSTKAQHVQAVISGIAVRLGGDHTHDLARLLRLPGTLNRKNEVNGDEPKPTVLVECEPSRRYAFSEFEAYADAAPDRKRREKVAKVPLPTPRRLTAGNRDKMVQLITICDAVEPGHRSEADFSLCCFCIEKGIDRNEVWSQVQAVGKFAEEGQRYFERTWEAAEARTRDRLYQRAECRAVKPVAFPPRSSRETNHQPTDGVETAAQINISPAALQNPDDVGLTKYLADLITDEHHFAQNAGGKLYYYRDGVFRPGGEQFALARIKQLVNAWQKTAQWSPRLADAIVEYIRVDAPELWERPPLDVLNVHNGLLQIGDRHLLPHSPSHLSSVQFPVDFDPVATCPHTEEFVEQVFPADAQLLAWEVVAWLMRPDVSIQKAILLAGEGANGKSTWLAQLIAFLGKGHTSGLSLHKLESDRFAAARLVGKLANICPDLPSEHLAGTSVFKAITGGDTLTAEYKFHDSFEFVPFARLVFSANHMPRSQDASYAFFRRWVVVPFDRTFAPSEQIPRDVMDARLSSRTELSGLLNKALDALPRLTAQRGFTEVESVCRALEDFHATTDPFAVWLDQHTVDDPVAFVEKGRLRSAYNFEAGIAGRPNLGNKAFGMRLAKLRPQLGDAQRMVCGKLKWCYVGIGLKQDRPINADDHVGSLNSRDSRDDSYSVINRTRETRDVAPKECEGVEQDRAHCVNRVNGMSGPGDSPEANGQCDHVWEDAPTGDGSCRRACSVCGKFYGWVQTEAESLVLDGDP